MYVVQPVGGIADDVERIVRNQVDRALDTAGSRFNRYLDSPEGQATLDKFESKIETALVNVAHRRRWDIALAVASASSLVVAGVAAGSKIGFRGASTFAGLGVALALPLLFASDLQSVAKPPRR